MVLKTFFWVSISAILYNYLVYTLILYTLVNFKRFFLNKKSNERTFENLPDVTIFITSYNEKTIIPDKIKNTCELDYPADKLKQLWITDGSDDGTYELLRSDSRVEVNHQPERKGKIDAMNRGMNYVKTPIVIFSDANTILSKDAVNEIVLLFQDKSVGCIAGEKRIHIGEKEDAVVSGEGIYWHYESLIKRLESRVSSTMGAAGELFSIRTELFEPVEPDTILDDFVISLKIAKKGYKIKYTSKAYATENASFDIAEEMKRKVRIAIGGFQTLFRMKELLNIFRYGWLSFQFISHKVLRWAVVPFAFILIFLLNFFILIKFPGEVIYQVTFYLQLLFYFFSLIGLLLKKVKMSFKIIFLPYYLFFMNYSLIRGFILYIRGNYSVRWEKAKRKV